MQGEKEINKVLRDHTEGTQLGHEHSGKAYWRI